VAIELLTNTLRGTGITSSDTFEYYSKRSKAYERIGKHLLANKDFRTGVKLTFDKKDAELYFKQGQEWEDTEKSIADLYFKNFGQKMEGAEDQEYKEFKIERFKIAAILGHKKAQAWLKKKRIEW
jgi:calcineurin-like phosphoesterase family protein